MFQPKFVDNCILFNFRKRDILKKTEFPTFDLGYLKSPHVTMCDFWANIFIIKVNIIFRLITKRNPKMIGVILYLETEIAASGTISVLHPPSSFVQKISIFNGLCETTLLFSISVGEINYTHTTGATKECLRSRVHCRPRHSLRLPPRSLIY